MFSGERVAELRLPRRVVVTGGAGFIGSHTVEALVATGAAVLVLDDLSHPCGSPLPAGAELVAANAGSEEAARVLRAFAPDAVLHLASKGGVERVRRDPGEHVRRSVACSVALFHSAIAAGASRIVTASSGGAVYGDAARYPASEADEPAPVSAYGASKLAEEAYLGAFGRQHGAGTVALRFGNVYGPRQDGTGEAGVVAITCTRLLEGRAPLIYGDGLQTRDFVYVEDVARACLATLAATFSGIVNVGTSRETSVLRVVEELVRLHGWTGRIEHSTPRGAEVRRGCLDIARAGSWLGWTPAVALPEGLGATLSHFRDKRPRADKPGSTGSTLPKASFPQVSVDSGNHGGTCEL